MLSPRDSHQPTTPHRPLHIYHRFPSADLKPPIIYSTIPHITYTTEPDYHKPQIFSSFTPQPASTKASTDPTTHSTYLHLSARNTLPRFSLLMFEPLPKYSPSKFASLQSPHSPVSLRLPEYQPSHFRSEWTPLSFTPFDLKIWIIMPAKSL